MTEQEITQKEVDLKLKEENLKTWENIAMCERLNQTSIIQKVSKRIINELTEAGHICVHGERLAKMETKLDTLLENQNKIDQKIDSLYEGKNKNSKRIDRLETIGSIAVFLTGVGWAFFVWAFDNFKWSTK